MSPNIKFHFFNLGFPRYTYGTEFQGIHTQKKKEFPKKGLLNKQGLKDTLDYGLFSTFMVRKLGFCISRCFFFNERQNYLMAMYRFSNLFLQL